MEVGGGLRSGLHIEFQAAVNTRKMDSLLFPEAPEWPFRRFRRATFSGQRDYVGARKELPGFS